MEILVYRQGEQRSTKASRRTNFRNCCRRRAAVIWVDMESPTEADEQVLLDVFHFHPLTVEDCRENRHYPKVEEFPGYLYFIVHGVRADTSPDRFNTIELDGFLGPNYVITYHHDTSAASPTSNNCCTRAQSLPARTGVSVAPDPGPGRRFLLPRAGRLRRAYLELEETIFTLKTTEKRDPGADYGLETKRAAVAPYFEQADGHSAAHEPGEFHALIPEDMRPFYRDIYDHIVRVTDLAESYRDLISGSLEAYLSVVSNRMNEIMKVLTIFSAIMLPLTFIAGVYGMNFDNMPELHSRYGYFGTLILMGIVAVVMLVFFWRRGWLGGGGGPETP